MTQIVTSTMITEVTYDESKNNRFLVKKEWDKSKKKALIIMKNTGITEEVMQDQTTMYVVNNLSTLGYGTVTIANLYPNIKGKETRAIREQNLKCIEEAAKNSDDVIIAVGKGIETNKDATERLQIVTEIIGGTKARLLETESISSKRRGMHPLSPELKRGFALVPYVIKEKKDDK